MTNADQRRHEPLQPQPMNFVRPAGRQSSRYGLLTDQQAFLSASSLTEEALILAASYAQCPRPMLIVKNNLVHTAQRLAES